MGTQAAWLRLPCLCRKGGRVACRPWSLGARFQPVSENGKDTKADCSWETQT